MLKKMVLVSALFIGAFAFTPAHAAPQGPMWKCRISGDVSGGSIGFIIGFKAVSGPGEITCRAVNGRRVFREPVRLGFYGAGLAYDLTYVRSMKVRSADFGVAGNPRSLLGRYSLGANLGATVIAAGVSADAAFVVSRPGLSFSLGLIGEEAYGLGVRALGRYFEVRAY